MKRNENLPVHLYKLAGSVPVSFPLKPYQSQIEIVSKMLSAIKYAKNGVFESPTGTGKSLAILLGSISLQEQLCSENRIPNHSIPEVDHDSERPLSLPILPKRGLVFSSPIKPSTTMAAREVFQSSPIRNAKVLLTSDLDSDQTQPSKVWNQKVIISSRTQKQLIQLVKELREKTNFNPSMAMVASRYFYCIHPQRHTWDSKDEECIILKKGRPPTDEEIIAIPDVHKIHCPFEENSGLLAGQSRFRTELWDIEDLVEAGKQHQACPFYASKRLAKESKLIFAPYNYILDPRIRKACSLPLDNSVVVIDEGS